MSDLASLEYKDENALLEGADDTKQVYVNEILPVKLAFYEKYVDEQDIAFDFRLILKPFLALVR
jgi:hypothetical protein